MQPERMPLLKVFSTPLLSLDETSVEVASLLVLFLAVLVATTVRRRRQLVRRLVQGLSFLVFFYVVYSCLGVFGMVRNSLYGLTLIGTVYTESFYWLALPVVVLGATLVSGPLFCGWICPTGTIQELFTMGRELLTRRRPVRATPVSLALLALFFALFLWLVFRFSAERQLFLEDSSLYWAASLLVLVLLVLTRVIDDVPTRALRWVSFISILASALFKTVITSPVHFAFVDVFDPASAVTTLILALASIFIGRAWCRYLCPWGQLMSLVHVFSRLRIRLRPTCTSCGTCAAACRVGAIDLEPRRVRTRHCQLCFACVDACPSRSVFVADVWRGGTDAGVRPAEEPRTEAAR